jgi:hypothetical protein
MVAGPGVRLKKRAEGVEEITQQIDALEDKISSIPAPTKPSPEAAINTKLAASRFSPSATQSFPALA